ncbi:MAG: SDR family NAD(P)-dependent oxidoreductase [Pseudomonadota bacterium]
MTESALQAATKDYPVGIFTSVFTGDELFLADHIIQGKKILPGMAYLEITRAAVACSVPISDKHIIVLSDSVFVKALLVSEKCVVEVKVYPGANGEFGVEVSTEQGVHFQSKAYIRDRQEQRAESLSSSRLDVAALAELCPKAGPTKQQFYAIFKKRGVELGPSHRGVETIKLGEDCALATVSLPGSSIRGMDLDPGMLDSIIQSGFSLATNPEANVVPFAVKRTKVFGPLTDSMTVYIEKTDEGFDYTVADDQGEVKVIITGFVTREIDLSVQQDQLVYYKPEWQEVKASVDDERSNNNVTIIKAQSDYASLVKSIFTSAQQLIQHKTEQHIIEVQLPADKTAWQGVIAQLKTITLEYPKISYRLKLGDKVVTLDYRVLDLASAPVYSWQDNKTILITGGLGGLGMLFAQDIAETSKGCTLILVGRSELNAEKKEFVARLENLGAKIICAQCDITQQSEVNALLAEYPQITGIIHGSGIINDNLIIKKSLAEIDRVLAPKVSGLEYLDQASAGLKLDYFIALSSIAGTLGNAGQTDYSAANGYMDSYIHNRALQVKNQQRFGKSISINWPIWESAGMQIDEATRQNLLQVFKIKPLPSAFGLTALKQIIASDQPQIVVLFGNKKAISTLFDKTSANAKPKVAQAQKKTSHGETSKLAREILQEIRMLAAEHLKLKPNQLDDTADWAVFGFDSILLSSFVNKFNTHFSLNLMPTILFEATNIQLFSQYLLENHAEQMAKKLALTGEEQPITKVAAPVEIAPEEDLLKISSFAQGFKKAYKSNVAYREKDIAIIGMSCRIAGARNLDEFWQMLDQEKDMISEIPQDRWDWRDYPECSKWGSFIEGVKEFDSLFFGISPAEAMYMVPEQRLMMQYVWECLDNAGCGGDDMKGTNTGLFVGCGPSGYTSILSTMPVEAYTATGMISSVGPNRISYLKDWHGPSNPIETACSSALVAVHRAVEAIHAGHCDQAIAGGINLLLAPDGYISFSKAGMLAEDGRCKTFSNQANGYVRGEGVGMLMLKPLKTALQDGNVIHAVVKGTAENHGGRTNSLTAPNPKSQAAVIKKAVSDADIDFSRVSYIECHGTGTELGDPVEIKGLKTVANDLLEDRDSNQICKLGSIKSNIGHLEYAAGAVGLIKVVLQMQHKKIARSLHCDQINPYIDLAGTPFAVAQSACDWQVAPGQTRIAGVSSFGFGGVNAHIILEEFQELPVAPEDSENDPDQQQLLIISARNEESLIDYVAQFPDFIKTMHKSSTTLKRMAYTLQTGRSEMQERVVFVAKSIDEWAEQLDTFLQEKGKAYNRKIYRGSVKSNATNNLEIGDTQAGKDYIKQLIVTNEAEKLAELWVKGTKIDWQFMHA